MSSNNIVYLDPKTNKVWYQGCADNDGYGELQGNFNTIEEAILFAKDLVKKYEVEYGVKFV